MPDGDKIHTKLRFFYQKVYTQLCETTFDDEDVARDVLTSIRRAIKYDGGGRPFRMLEIAAAQLERVPLEPLARKEVDWTAVTSALEQIARDAKGKKRIVELALSTSKETLHDLRSGQIIEGALATELYKNYLSNLYMSEFEGNIPLAEHYNGVTQQSVDERLASIRPYVIAGLEKFAGQIGKRGTGTSLRLPKRTKARSPINLHETDLLAGF